MVPKEHKTGVVSLPNCFNGIMPGGSHGHVALYIRPNSGSKELPIFRDIRPMFPFANFAKSIRCLDCRISFSTCLNLGHSKAADCRYGFPRAAKQLRETGVFLQYGNVHTRLPPCKACTATHYTLLVIHGSRKKRVLIVACCG